MFFLEYLYVLLKSIQPRSIIQFTDRCMLNYTTTTTTTLQNINAKREEFRLVFVNVERPFGCGLMVYVQNLLRERSARRNNVFGDQINLCIKIRRQSSSQLSPNKYIEKLKLFLKIKRSRQKHVKRRSFPILISCFRRQSRYQVNCNKFNNIIDDILRYTVILF